MTLFFFLVALELKRELILGELRNQRMAALSISAAVGGMLVPAVCYLILPAGQTGQNGWGIVMATDTAFVQPANGSAIGVCTLSWIDSLPTRLLATGSTPRSTVIRSAPEAFPAVAPSIS